MTVFKEKVRQHETKRKRTFRSEVIECLAMKNIVIPLFFCTVCSQLQPRPEVCVPTLLWWFCQHTEGQHRFSSTAPL